MLEGDVFLVVFGFLLTFITVTASTLFIFSKIKKSAARQRLERTNKEEDDILEAQLRENEKILNESLAQYESSRNKIELNYFNSSKELEKKIEAHQAKFLSDFDKDPVNALKESAKRLGFKYAEQEEGSHE